MRSAKLHRLVAPCFAVMLAACQTGSYVKENYVYLREGPGYTRENVPAAFRAAFDAGQPVVLFIHGRGNEPGKSLKGASYLAHLWKVEGFAVRRLEEHKVTVVLLSWDSTRNAGFLDLDFYDRTRALENSAEAAERLADVVRSLSSIGPGRPGMVLIAHSMGAIVVEKYVRKYGAFPPGMFSNVLLSSADADNVGHESWVETLTRTSRVYVTVNENDGILSEATDARDFDRVQSLGRNPGSVLAPGAIYVRLSDSAYGLPELRAHEAFYLDPWDGYRHVRNFYGTVLRGSELDLGNARQIGVVSGNLYRLLAQD